MINMKGLTTTEYAISHDDCCVEATNHHRVYNMSDYVSLKETDYPLVKFYYNADQGVFVFDGQQAESDIITADVCRQTKDEDSRFICVDQNIERTFLVWSPSDTQGYTKVNDALNHTFFVTEEPHDAYIVTDNYHGKQDIFHIM